VLTEEWLQPIMLMECTDLGAWRRGRLIAFAR
jgi:hypothetical protein